MYVCKAASDNLPPNPSDGKVTCAQRDTAEPTRAQIRQNERQLRNQPGPAGSKPPPLVVHNQLSQAVHNAEQIVRSRQEEQAAHLAIHGQLQVTRKPAAKLRRNHEDWSGDELWETRTLRLMYPTKTFAVESTDNDRALAEVIAAEEDADALKDADPLPSTDGKDGSDFHDALHEKELDDVLEAEEGSSNENDVDRISEEGKDEESDEDGEIGESKFGAAPKIYQTTFEKQKRMCSCTCRVFEEDLRFLGGFSRRVRSVPAGDIPAILETSVTIRNNQMTKNAEALKTAGNGRQWI
ncbi:hypothetical protein GN244_ATG00581 [Phytophthora infestans]|uniref:Uncharacterized protein n=1 Tax=Phytophthora infestans TaxID=4787 RepID=A0A833T4N9_PHYIN|nr:hypothetical protein GN244_ATG00581 [Phytophthora infestans]